MLEATLKSDRGLPAFALSAGRTDSSRGEDGLRRGERGYHGLAIRKAGKEEEEEGPFPNSFLAWSILLLVLIICFFALICGIRAIRGFSASLPA
jgi:hypothetical protein